MQCLLWSKSYILYLNLVFGNLTETLNEAFVWWKTAQSVNSSKTVIYWAFHVPNLYAFVIQYKHLQLSSCTKAPYNLTSKCFFGADSSLGTKWGTVNKDIFELSCGGSECKSPFFITQPLCWMPLWNDVMQKIWNSDFTPLRLNGDLYCRQEHNSETLQHIPF